MLASTSASAAVVPGRVILRTDDSIGGVPVTAVYEPFVNDGGAVGLLATLQDGDHALLVDGAAVWQGSMFMGAFLGIGEPTMDSTAAGGFVYSPSANGVDALFTDMGQLAIANDQAVGYAPGSTYVFHSRPTMTADGTIYWVAGINTGGSPAADDKALYRTPDGTAGSIEVVLRTGDMVDGLVVDDAGSGSDGGVDSDYAISEDGAHRIHVLNVEGDSAFDVVVVVDDVVVMREGEPTGMGDNWASFDLVSINANGDYLATGNTDTDEATDEFLAYNGAITIREGDVIGGVTLQTQASLRFASINDQGQATHAWGYQMAGSFRETIFFSCNAADLGASSLPVLTTFADSIDVDDDMVGDFTVQNMLSTTAIAARGLGETPFVYALVELNDGTSSNAVVEIPVICCGNGLVDPGEDCDDTNDDDTDDCLTTCLAASCGDGFLQDGVEECDDGNTDDGDECTSACLPAACGDGFVHDGVEECDDGNLEDGDGCRSDCTIEPEPGTTGDGLDESGGGSGGASAGTTGGPMTGADASGTGETDTDTDSGGISDGGGGCGCVAGQERPLTGFAWLLGLGVLGFGRRRRR
ncbi:DUF4215 domain-containing protein [Paraliomyxa miuraensis]|uniref:DUF4215 domain-containing protein n=1 Tax=Paraliomyxa miuraensis TaxID=376150 RepID=UPI002256F8BF|nr:DUF4215 domain-containing protein [Paraliomyxa miuraensis]MCX4245297.1 DUF4215 domain-containing protein [Paraliomyxa miuraensis]